MSAAEKSRLSGAAMLPRAAGPDPEIIAILAGGGQLPDYLAQSCERAGITPFIVAFKGQTDPALYQDRAHMLTRLGAAGQVIATLKNRAIRDIVMIGPLRRPTLAELKPDLRTARFFARISFRALGDDGLLGAVRAELEREGFIIHGVQRFAGELLTAPGPLGRYQPKKADQTDIARGVAAAQALGRLDVGQAVIVQEGIVLGVEAIEGTKELIARCAGYARKGRPPLLIKLCKPGQDTDIDLPTIGPDTVAQCAAAGIGGIIVEAGRSLMVDREQIAVRADSHKMFVIGIDPAQYLAEAGADER